VTYPATDILDVYQACHPETPLEPGDPRYVDLREVRGGRNLARVIYRRIASTEPSDYHQHLITGHRGCGKSTELKQIKGALEDEDLFCVYFDVEEVLDVQDLKYLDVLLAVARVVARVVGERLDDEGMELPEELLTHLDD
jgi:ABC-type iron transport system FetAB ATPase subunit